MAGATLIAALMATTALSATALAQSATPIPQTGAATGSITPTGTAVSTAADVESAMGSKVDTVNGWLTHATLVSATGTPVSVNSLLSDWFVLRSYGVTMDGSTDDWAAFQGMINATAPANLAITIPACTIALSRQLTTTGGRNISLQGSGSATTTLRWTDPTSAGWNHGQGTAGAGTFAIRGVTLAIASTVTGTTALRVSAVPASTNSRISFLADDVQVGIHGTATWSIGFDLYGCTNAEVSNTSVISTPWNLDANSISLRYQVSEATAAVTVQLSLMNFTTQDGVYGLWIGDRVQGVSLVNSNLTGPRYGVYWAATPTGGSDELEVSNCQINSSIRHVYATNVTSVLLANNYMIQGDQFETDIDWGAIELINCGGFSIAANKILDPGGTFTSNVAAIWVHGPIPRTDPSIISGNVLETNNTFAVQISDSARYIKVIGNNFHNNPPSNTTAVRQTDSDAWVVTTTYAAFSSVTANGYTFYTAAGGTSGSTAPTNTVPNDGGIAWTVVGQSLAVAPNEVWGNSNYGTWDFQASGNGIRVGQPTGQINIPQDVEVGGSASTQSVIDMHSGASSNDYDVRVIATGGTSGTNGVGSLQLVAGKLGFFTTIPVAKPTISGATGGNVALGNLIAALAAYGLVVDSTTT